MFKDKDLLQIFEAIIKSYEVKQERGLPIGNLTSQYFANHYLCNFDHFVKEKLKAKAYVRYMDDMILWTNSSCKINEFYNEIEIYLKKHLLLELNPISINTTHYGLDFLSYRILKTHIELQRKSKKRFISKIKNYYINLENGNWSQHDFAMHLESLSAFTMHASSKGFREKVFEKTRT